MSDDAQVQNSSQHGNELAKAYDPTAIEEKWAAYWVAEKLFDTPDPLPGEPARKPFTMLLPPPNVTGRLHMGHMLNQTEMDILTRWHRMRGERALWVPGTDHAGIATQMMVERQLAAEGKTTREQLGREAFTERVWTWKREYGGAITDQMRRLGASVDWAREYFTMDDDLSRAVVEAFVRLHEQGLIYRGAYIVNWDPQAQTAVSDLEVETEDRLGKLYSIRYDLVDGSGSITVATTRPETMLGDVAVAVNPADERYKPFLGQLLKLPLTGREIPVVADDWANPEFGTGAVKVTPAHDPNDYAIGQRHNLPNITILDKTARIDLPPAALADSPEGHAAKLRYQGKDRFEARKLVLADLEALGQLVAVKDHQMAVPVSQRTGSVIEPRLSDQWFIRIQPLADKAIAAVRDGHIRFTPEMYQKTYFEWMENIHDWCISRQLWWGHRIPAWHCGSCHQITVARTAPDACRHCGSAALEQETDVLDTWFSSGLLPFTVFGWPDASPADYTFYPTDLLVTGSDILFFWVARMIMLGTHFMLDIPNADGTARSLADAVPFREVYIHSLVRAADGQKMSKTKGNVVDPLDMIARFGTDAVRFTLASMASPGTDIAFSEERTDGYRAFANKIWNSARFLFMNLDRARSLGIEIDLPDFGERLRVTSLVTPSFRAKLAMPRAPENAEIEARWILGKLSNTAAQVTQALNSYRFDEAAREIYEFFWQDFCDLYIECLKVRLDFESDSARLQIATALRTTIEVFEASLRLLAPFMPFLTEELWNYLLPKSTIRSISLTWYPIHVGVNTGLELGMDLIRDVIRLIRQLRKQMGVPEKESVPIRFSSLAVIEDLLHKDEALVLRLARVSTISYLGPHDELAPGPNVASAPNFDVQVIYERQIDVPAERERLTKELAKLEKGLLAGERQLGNEAFMAKAPAHIVEGLRKQAAETRALYDKARSALDALPPA